MPKTGAQKPDTLIHGNEPMWVGKMRWRYRLQHAWKALCGYHVSGYTTSDKHLAIAGGGGMWGWPESEGPTGGGGNP